MLEVKNISAGYGKTEVLSNVSFNVDEGARLCIVGPNGAGKTTLLRAVAGLTDLMDGEVILDGRNIASMKRKDISRKIALMPQTTEIYFSYTVEETVLMGRFAQQTSLFSGTTQEDSEAVEKALEATGCTDFKNKQINELSGGQLQRVLLARTFAQSAPIILLDEPNNHLDIKYRAEINDYILNWCEGKTDGVKNTLIGVFHDLSEALHLCDTALLMSDGKVIDFGKTGDLFTRDKLSNLYGFDVVSYIKQESNLWSE